MQEGCKGLLYMVLHARVVLDLNEELEKEISFEQVEGDFDSFQGRCVNILTANLLLLSREVLKYIYIGNIKCDFLKLSIRVIIFYRYKVASRTVRRSSHLA